MMTNLLGIFFKRTNSLNTCELKDNKMYLIFILRQNYNFSSLFYFIHKINSHILNLNCFNFFFQISTILFSNANM